MAFKECLARMRRALVESGAVAAIVPTADPHLNEYIRAEWAVREALSGFTGSAGTLLVSIDAAASVGYPAGIVFAGVCFVLFWVKCVKPYQDKKIG